MTHFESFYDSPSDYVARRVRIHAALSPPRINSLYTSAHKSDTRRRDRSRTGN